jgi:hypothetical protein
MLAFWGFTQRFTRFICFVKKRNRNWKGTTEKHFLKEAYKKEVRVQVVKNAHKFGLLLFTFAEVGWQSSGDCNLNDVFQVWLS